MTAGDAPQVELLFVSLPLTGHISPLIAVAAACARKRAAAAAAAAASAAAADNDVGGKNNSSHNNNARAAAAAAAAATAAATVAVASLSSARARVEAAGVRFLDLGEPEPALGAEIGALQSRSMSGTPDSIPAALEMFALYGAAMLPSLRAALAPGAPAGGAKAIIADFVSLAGHDAAEVARLPLALLHQVPLSWALSAAGLPEYNLPSHVPLEAVGFAPQSEPVTRAQRLINPLLKRVSARAAARAMLPFRDAARARAGLPPAKGRHGPFEAAPGLPATCHIVSGSMALEVERPLPPGWHMSGPQNVDFSGGRFPLPLPDDAGKAGKGGDEAACGAAVARFLRAAAADGAPVVYVATGTIVAPTAAQVAAIADGIRAARAATGARFVWSLRKECQELLPPGFLSGHHDGEAAAAAADDDDTADNDATGGGDNGASGVLVVPWAPQQAVLCHPSVRLFATHGGLNSTYEGLAAGVPLLVLPWSADQPLNACHVQSKGFGAALDPWRMRGADFAAAVERCLADGGMALRVRALGEELRRVSGAERAAGILEAFVADSTGGAPAAATEALAVDAGASAVMKPAELAAVAAKTQISAFA